MSWIKVVVKLRGFPYLGERRDLEVKLKEGSTIYDLLDALHGTYGLPRERYEERCGVVNAFYGNILLRNSEAIGFFEKDGLKLYQQVNAKLSDGDELMMVLPFIGG